MNDRFTNSNEILSDSSPSNSEDESNASEDSKEKEEADLLLQKAKLKAAMSAMTNFIEKGDYLSENHEDTMLEYKNPAFSSMCTEKLKKLALPTKVVTIHSGQTLPVAKLYIGATFFQNYLNQERDHTRNLDRACFNGDYYALKTRSENNLEIVIDKQSSQTEKSKALAQIKEDLDTVSELYWSVGHSLACRIYHIIGNYYHRIRQLPEMQAFYEISVTHMNWAKFLEKRPESAQMIADIYKDMGIHGTGWESAEKMEEEVTRHLSDECKKLIKEKVYSEVTYLFSNDRGERKRK